MIMPIRSIASLVGVEEAVLEAANRAEAEAVEANTRALRMSQASLDL